jgi:adenine-specific DNA-methyltransferase
MNIFKQTVEKILKTEEAFLDAETKELNYTKVKDSADRIDPKLIGLLADHKETKEKFFTKIKDVYVFNINDFKFFLDENKINNSYTQYANQIGLSDGVDFLEDRGEVVLSFPYKDCVLEGGQSTEEGMDEYFEWSDKSKKYEEKTAKRSEVFFNQVLARDEIDRLFDKKALINWKRHTKDSGKDGVAVKDIERDENGTIKENFVIKGNNLLALHSLKSEFAGKIKLIYIDPPYNTGNDGFKYNDNFTHSTWLTFMKNRLEVAKKLLKDDGIIFVQCDNNEQAYLKILMDEVFGRENFRNNIVWRKLQSAKKQSSYLSNITEHILVYTKSNSFKLNKLFLTTEEGDDLKNYPYVEGKTKRRYGSFDFTQKGKGEAKLFNGKLLAPPEGKHWIWNQEGINEGIKNNRIIFTKNGLPRVKRYLDEKEGNPLSDLWNDNEVKIISANDKERFDFDGQKPEGLLKRIIEITTEKGELVLDYHAGTGTTLAVSHKTGRQWIGVEQLDYIHELPEARLINVINGDQTGISKSVNWKGGGSFIYCELAKWNEQAKDEINGAKDYKALEKMFDTLYEKYFLNYNVKIKEFKEKVSKEENFKKLTLDEQKRMFLTMLDLNQMYVQESEMGDKRFAISKEDQKFTKAFYGK